MNRLIARILTLGTMVLAAHALADQTLDELYERYWNLELETSPFAATAAGDPRFNARVPDVTPEAQQRYLERLAAIETELQDGIAKNRAANDPASAAILSFILRHDIALGEFDGWRMPFNADSGFHVGIGYIVRSTRFANERDYRDYLTRLAGLPGYLGDQQANMRMGLDAGFSQPREIMADVLPSFAALVVADPEAHPLFKPFDAMPTSIPEETRAALRAEALALFESEVLPAFDQLHGFMRDVYVPGARTTLGASSLPDGRRYYEALVRYYTTLESATPENVHERGLAEVARIRAEMQAIIAETGFDGTFDEFLTFLRTDPQFYAKTPEELLQRAAWIAKQTDGRLPAYFGKLPRQPYSVEPVPAEIAPNYTAGRYSPAPPGSDHGGQYWVNTYALETRPLYQLPALSLHEGVPGHHLQGALSYEIENAPKFREQFYPHAFGEGWGLYSEKLGVEMGIYQTPYEHFGRLSYEMWRACRLVVDTGIHAMGWTREQARDYLATNTALSHHEIRTEVDRYVSWPGQALAYKIGELTIWDLRHEAEAELGDDFDIREFHDTILVDGGLPLDLLRVAVRNYIDETKSAPDNR